MNFRLPTFPLVANIWHWSNWAGTVPPTAAPDLRPPVNLIPGRRNMDFVTNLSSYLLLPKLTDIRFSQSGIWTSVPAADPDLVEVPAGSGRYYKVWDVERSGGGFANEHLVASITKYSPFGGGGSGPPTPGTVVEGAFGLWDFGEPLGTAIFTLTGAISKWDLILVLVVMNPNQTLAVSDSLGNTYTLFVAEGTSFNDELFAYYCLSTASGTPTITVAGNSFEQLKVKVSTFSGGGSTLHPTSPGAATGSGTVIAFPAMSSPLCVLNWCAFSTEAGSNNAYTGIIPSMIIDFNSAGSSSVFVPGAASFTRVNDSSSLSPVATIANSGIWAAVSACFVP